MLRKNKKISLSGEAALEILTEIEFILISLHKIGSHYIDKPVADYRQATTVFIDNEKVTERLARVRRVISEQFDTTLGEDDMDDIERHMEHLEYWKP
ncbi:hypothetical protein [Pseudomonas chlororaphis]|uniref:hypothetical protein n=1 Tax=Pseudomonas chlororaphis TaxID=587753 RepID=UPI002366F25D|nr:hypothetical protein [Pseudomonas chlororaphis]WDH23152.1 hypothetical protein PUP50_02360 [Pseudomonas chlororaphis]